MKSPRELRKLIPIEGRNTVHDAILSPQSVESLLISSAVRNDPRIKEIEKLAKERNIRTDYISPHQLQHLTESHQSQGVIAYMQKPEIDSLHSFLEKTPNPFILLFNQLDYEQNLGSILRTSWAAGVDLVITNPSGVHEVTPVVAKVSMGGAAHVPVLSQSLFQALTTLKKFAIKIIGVEVDQGSSYTETNLTGPIALLFGGEASGLTPPLYKYCDTLTHIPMARQVASLNVNVATSIILFEKLRQSKIKI